jgi:hypothetical protein
MIQQLTTRKVVTTMSNNETSNIEQAQNIQDSSNVEQVKTDDKSINRVAPSPQNVREVDQIDGYVTTDKAAKLLGEALNTEVKTNRINYLAYSKQVDAVRIGSTMLINKASLESLYDVIKQQESTSIKRAELKKQLSDVKANKDLPVREYERLIKEIKAQLDALK